MGRLGIRGDRKRVMSRMATTHKSETVPFHGSHIEAVRDGEIVWVSVRRMCEALGLDYSGQHKKLTDAERAPWARTTIMTATGPDGKSYKSFCLDMECVPAWLASISRLRVNSASRQFLAPASTERLVVTYFIGGADLVKIGRTSDLRGRLMSLSNGSPVPLTCLGVLPADREAEMHSRFSRHRRHGEWFARHVDIITFIERSAITYEDALRLTNDQ